MSPPWAWLLCVVLGWASGGCGERYAPLDSRQVERGLNAAARVRPEVVLEHVRAIHAARLGDVEVDFDYSRKCPQPDCTYSREATARYVRRTWRESLEQPELHEQSVRADGLSTTNLYVDIAARSDSDEWILAVAHYDAWFGGANDNATGVAVTLEAAHALQSIALDHNVRLLLTDGEELGLVGTQRYLREYGTEGIRLVLNADMVAHVGTPGSFITQEPDGVEYIVQANEHSEQEAFQLADLARRLPASLRMQPVIFPGHGVSVVGFATGVDLSDHGPFWLEGLKALFPFPANDKPAWYHTPDDTPDRVDGDRLSRFARLWAAALAAFATEPG